MSQSQKSLLEEELGPLVSAGIGARGYTVDIPLKTFKKKIKELGRNIELPGIRDREVWKLYSWTTYNKLGELSEFLEKGKREGKFLFKVDGEFQNPEVIFYLLPQRKTLKGLLEETSDKIEPHKAMITTQLYKAIRVPPSYEGWVGKRLLQNLGDPEVNPQEAIKKLKKESKGEFLIANNYFNEIEIEMWASKRIIANNEIIYVESEPDMSRTNIYNTKNGDIFTAYPPWHEDEALKLLKCLKKNNLFKSTGVLRR